MRKYINKKSKKSKSLFILLSAFSVLIAKGDSWTRKADLPGVGRSAPITFSINDSGYAGLGTDGALLFDFYQYNSIMDSWSPKANFPGIDGIDGSVCFAINAKGFAVTGSNGPSTLKSVWQYDQSSDIWTQKTDFGGSTRGWAIGYAIGSKGYTGMGNQNGGTFFKDFWEYNPATDSWTQKSDFGGALRSSGVSFSIGVNGYVGLGWDSHYNYHKDFWRYDSSNDTWTQIADFAGDFRIEAVAFSISNNGYVGTGKDSIGFKHDFWEYSSLNNIWIQKSDFGGVPRCFAGCFMIGNKGYIGMGFDSATHFLNDFWEYNPDSITGIPEFQVSNLQFLLSPNPAHNTITCTFATSSQNKIQLTIYDINGRKMTVLLIPPSGGGRATINTSSYSAGVYFIEATDEKDRVVQKFVTE